ncbi:MAG TPA: radical SAM/SPASM domain-containing protein [Pyrinomonadaceae bacterium]
MTNASLLPYDSRVNPYFPHQILMETTSACQLRCKMCAREESLKKGTLKIGQMEEWLAEKIIDEVASVNPKTRLWFCYFGEPTISKQLWRRVRLAKDKGAECTIINSNGNLLKPAMADQLIDSGLDEIYIGLDAATAATYSRVRIRGDYDTVVSNINYLLRKKPERLKVTVQFGVYEENEHELEDFKKQWADHDVTVFIRPKLTWIGTLPEHFHTQHGRYPCPWIFDSLPIYFNGLVPYCICDWDNRLPAGDIKTHSIVEVWQSAYRKWQNIQLAGRFEELPDFCRACRDWQAKPLHGTLEELFDHRWTFEDCEMEKPAHIRDGVSAN